MSKSNVGEVDDRVIHQLRALAEQAEAAADRWTAGTEREISDQYSLLREQARVLADEHGWTDAAAFSAYFPDLGDLALIELLNEQWTAGQTPAPVPSEAGSPVQRSLRRLAAWAIGVRLAGELHL